MNSIIRAASRLASRPVLERFSFVKPLSSQQSSVTKRWAHNCPLTYDFARERIMLVLHLYDKIDPNKLTLDSHFIHDLGLNSLDHTEIIMEMEDEFRFEIPDRDAEHLLRPSDIVRYITDKEEAYKELQDLQIADHHHHHDHGHGHDNQDKVDSYGIRYSDPNFQKREFSTLTTVAKRYKKEYPTSFAEPTPKEINYDEIQNRVMKVCAKYDKIDSSKLDLVSHFVDDLGLDSLDHVEIMMELEDEFALEIPDQDAEKLMRPIEIAKYVFKKEEDRAVKPFIRPF